FSHTISGLQCDCLRIGGKHFGPVHEFLRARTAETLDGGVGIDCDNDVMMTADEFDQPVDGRSRVLEVVDDDVTDALQFLPGKDWVGFPEAGGCSDQS